MACTKRNKKFQEWEIAFIILAYPDYGAIELSKILNRHPSTISSKANKIGVFRINKLPYKRQEFDCLVVLDYIKKNNKNGKGYQTYCRCKCLAKGCGRIIDIKPDRLLGGYYSSCGCKGQFYKKFMIGNIPNIYFRRFKNSAKSTNRIFDISQEYMSGLLDTQNFKCALSGMEIFINRFDGTINSTASIDRIDSQEGYIKGNVQFVHKDINRLKTNFEQNYFIELCTRVSRHRNNEEYDDKTNDWW